MIRRKVLIAGIFLLLILVFIAKCPPVFPRTVPHLYKALPNAIPLVLGWGDLKETLELNSGTFFLPERTRQLLGKILDLSPSGKPVALVLGVQNTGKGEFVNTLILDWRKSSLSIASMAAQLDWQQQSESVFKNQAIYGFTTEDYGNFTIAHYQGLLLLGKYAFQVEEAIIQLIGDGQSIAEDKGFRKLSPDRKSNGQPLVSINVELFHTLGKDVWSDYVLSQIRKLAESYSWLGFRLKMKDNQVEIEGQYTPTSANSFVKAIAGKTGNDLNALSNILPANTAFFKQVHIGNTSEYFSTLTQNHPKWFEDHFLNWVTGDVALAQMENRHFLVLGCSNRPAMETGLDAFLASSGQLESAPYQSFEIRRVVEEDLLRPFWNEEGLSLKNPYVVILDNFAVFAEHRSALEIWIDQYIVGNTLGQDSHFLTLIQNQEQPYPAFIYWNSGLLKSDWQSLFNGKATSDAVRSFFKSFGQIGIYFDGRGRFRAVLNPLRNAETEARVLWRRPLKKEVFKEPRFLKNPVDRSDYILVQDAGYMLYQLNTLGEIRWKKQLEGPVVSDFILIDFYGSGQNQILFNTRSEIHLLDFDGMPVAGFPFQLPSTAIQALCTVDFQANNDYSFFVACENGNIYGMDERGMPLSGWNPLSEVGPVTAPIRHFQFEKKDYLIALGQQGSLFAFKQDASHRFAPIDFKAPFYSALAIQNSDAKVKIIVIDKAGRSHWIDLDGKYKSYTFNEHSEKSGQVVIADFTADQQVDILSLKENKLELKYRMGNQMKMKFQKFIEGNDNIIFEVAIPDKGKSAIGFLDREKQRIMLFDGGGELISGFPLPGSTKFDVGVLNHRNERLVVVGYGNEVQSYAIHY